MKQISYFILLVFLLIMIPEKSFAENKAEITKTINVRSGPSLSYNVIGQVHKGENLSIVDSSGEWLKVKLDSNETGWIAGWLVKSRNSDIVEVEPTVTGLQIRSGPGEEYKVIGSTNPGEVWKVSISKENWTSIHYNNGIGWVASRLIKDSKSNKREQLSAHSKKEVKASILNVRENPGTQHKILTQLPSGSIVSELKSIGKWSFIQYGNGETGWVDHTYLDETEKGLNSYLTILFNSTNLRSGPGLEHPVIAQASKNERYQVKNKKNQWYQIQLQDGTSAYVADWIVSTVSSLGFKNNRTSGKTVVLDAGHGGYDSGALGLFTYEKLLTLRTTTTIAEKLKNAGVRVILTRDEDHYVSLSERTGLSNQFQADAFVSVHYDSTVDPTANGYTTYYYHEDHYALASSIHEKVISDYTIRNRGIRHGNYYVLRNNRSPSVLLELGYISNPFEEQRVNRIDYQAKITSSIANGIINYLNHKR